jgi:tripartite-type tricarboxylate transporter receptor subunit TctC
LPVRSFQEFAAWARANPGKLSYGSPGLGTPHHLATELLAQKMGVKMTHAPYRGAGPAMLDVIGGQIPFMLVDSAAGRPTSTRARSAPSAWPARSDSSLPQTPTLIEQGVAGFEAFAWQGLVAPGARMTPPYRCGPGRCRKP